MNRFLPRSIGAQLVLLLLAGMVISQVITVALFFGERDEAVREAWKAEFAARVASVALLVEGLPDDLGQQFVAAARSGRVDYELAESPVVLLNNDDTENDIEMAAAFVGALLTRQERDVRVWRQERERNTSMVRAVRELVTRIGSGETRDESSEREPTMLISIELNNGSWLNVSVSGGSRGARMALLPFASAAIMALVMLVIVAAMVIRVTNPLKRLSASAEALGRGEPVSHLTESGPYEIRNVTHAFNEMNARLSRFVEDRTRMLAAISHDLRTPITALRVRAELVDDEETRERMIETLDDMKRMTEAVLTFSRDEAETEESRVVDLAALTESVIEDLRDVGYTVHFETDGPLPYLCRPASLKRALANFLENAVRYGNTARVRLRRETGAIKFVIDDDGPGIADDRLREVFEPFVRLESSRSAETGGVGLGLSIARSIVLSHGGTIELANRPEGGLRVSIALPQ